MKNIKQLAEQHGIAACLPDLQAHHSAHALTVPAAR